LENNYDDQYCPAVTTFTDVYFVFVCTDFIIYLFLGYIMFVIKIIYYQ